MIKANTLKTVNMLRRQIQIYVNSYIFQVVTCFTLLLKLLLTKKLMSVKAIDNSEVKPEPLDDDTEEFLPF